MALRTFHIRTLMVVVAVTAGVLTFWEFLSALALYGLAQLPGAVIVFAPPTVMSWVAIRSRRPQGLTVDWTIRGLTFLHSVFLYIGFILVLGSVLVLIVSLYLLIFA